MKQTSPLGDNALRQSAPESATDRLRLFFYLIFFLPSNLLFRSIYSMTSRRKFPRRSSWSMIRWSATALQSNLPWICERQFKIMPPYLKEWCELCVLKWRTPNPDVPHFHLDVSKWLKTLNKQGKATKKTARVHLLGESEYGRYATRS